MSKENTPTIHERMAMIKSDLSKTKIKKSGHNKYAGFKYHELSDFIEHINELNVKHGVNDFVVIDEETRSCSITLTSWSDSQDSYTLKIPYREAEMLAKGGAASNVDAIQRMGSTVTYNRRYLYMTAYNIQESDGVDSNEQNGSKVPANQPQPKKLLPLIQGTQNWDKVVTYLAEGGNLPEVKKKYTITPDNETELLKEVTDKA
jgi:hypothetical protein